MYWLILLLVCCTTFKVYAGDTSEVNKNFHSRFEYVIAMIEHITDYDNDVTMGLTLVIDKKDSRPLYIGVKRLYYILHGKQFETKDQLYFSVGKIFLRDTLNITKASLDLFKHYLVDTVDLQKLNRRKFEKNLLEWRDGGMMDVHSNTGASVMSYYFDRRFYPTSEIHNIGETTDFKYSFPESNLIQIFRGKEMYNQIYDQNGVLISEQEAQN